MGRLSLMGFKAGVSILAETTGSAGMGSGPLVSVLEIHPIIKETVKRVKIIFFTAYPIKNFSGSFPKIQILLDLQRLFL
jgi:hypothetical protein